MITIGRMRQKIQGFFRTVENHFTRQAFAHFRQLTAHGQKHRLRGYGPNVLRRRVSFKAWFDVANTGWRSGWDTSRSWGRSIDLAGGNSKCHQAIA